MRHHDISKYICGTHHLVIVCLNQRTLGWQRSRITTYFCRQCVARQVIVVSEDVAVTYVITVLNVSTIFNHSLTSLPSRNPLDYCESDSFLPTCKPSSSDKTDKWHLNILTCCIHTAIHTNILYSWYIPRDYKKNSHSKGETK